MRKYAEFYFCITVVTMISKKFHLLQILITFLVNILTPEPLSFSTLDASKKFFFILITSTLLIGLKQPKKHLLW